MSDELSPAKVRLTDGLGQLQRPTIAWPGDAYTPKEMETERQRCYALGVAAERERCARLAEEFADRAWNNARSEEREEWVDEFELLVLNIREA